MKSFATALLLISMLGCTSLEKSNKEIKTNWKAEDISGFTYKSLEENNPTEFRFYQDGYAVAIFGVEDGDDTIAPLVRWKTEKEKLIIYEGISEPLIYTILELSESEAVLQSAGFTHRFSKHKTKTMEMEK